MNLKEILKKLNIKNEKQYNRYNNMTYYTINHDYEKILNKWNDIYNLMKRKSIKKIENYIDLSEFLNDYNRILMNSIPPCNACPATFTYKTTNNELFEKYKEQILNKMFKIENIKKYKSPIIFLREINPCEKEQWQFGIKINESNLDYILKLKKFLIKMELNTRFKIENEIWEEEEIDFHISSGYFSSPILIENKINFKKILSFKNKEKLEDFLNKGRILRII